MLPTHKAVRDLLSDRTGRTVSLAPALPYAPGSRERVTYAVFVDARLRTRAVTVCDLTLSVLLGAAVARIPVGGTEAEIAEEWLAPGTTRHLRGLMEELAALLDTTGEVRLHEMYVPGVQPPTDVPAYAHTLGRRLDLEVEVSSYGGGRLSVVFPAV